MQPDIDHRLKPQTESKNLFSLLHKRIIGAFTAPVRAFNIPARQATCPHDPPRNRPWRALFALCLLGGIVSSSVLGVGGSHMTPHATAAKTYDYGVGLGSGLYFVGAYRHSNGQLAYCLELGAPINVADKVVDAEYDTVDTVPEYRRNVRVKSGTSYHDVFTPALTGQDIKTINWLYQNYGMTADRRQAAAAQLAIWQVREAGSSESYQRLLRDTKHLVNRYDSEAVGWGERMLTEARAAAASDGNIKGGNITITGTNGYGGSVTVPSGTKELAITNGLLKDSTGQMVPKIVWEGGVPAETTIKFDALPPAADGFNRRYRVSFTGKQLIAAISSSIRVSKDEGMQTTTGKPEPKKRETELQASYDLDTVWKPVLTTKTPSNFVAPGEHFSDTVTFGVAANSERWRESYNPDGTKVFAPITAKGTLYGPFAADPAEHPQDNPPENAPVAATAEITTDTAKPGGIYTVTSDAVASSSGYYSWVWSINAADQVSRAPAQNSTAGEDVALAPNYFFTDGFGQAREGQTVPMSMQITTKLSATEVKVGDKFSDAVTLTPRLNRSVWLQHKGENIPVIVRGTVYSIKDAPEQQSEVPKNAVKLLDLAPLKFTAAGISQNSEPVTLPETKGYITVVWCVNETDQEKDVKNMITPGCDDFGVPSETAKIVEPQQPLAQTGSARARPTLAAAGFTSAGLAVIGAGLLRIASQRHKRR